ncbi:hypothetical protein EV700_1532 [Fluviicoccus keumensis]|uniref:Uncharacterized protein n=1 Tax=Fluviicoccus keumensis TaxID=1435465 RepID=A0A4Q7Z9E9_9GAMM|nr:hypothetical protein [Fluviicoccus keumensis]RZU47140.1 hypothetical protein EV700_1532 [Fluviicoccus keumensis]
MSSLINAKGNHDAEMASNGLEAILVTDYPDLIFSQPEMIRLLCPSMANPFIAPEVLSVVRWVIAIKDNINVWSGMFGGHVGKSYARIYIDDCLGTLCQYFPALQLSADWIMFEEFGEMKPAFIEMARHQNHGAQSLLDKMWSGPDCLIQSQLLRHHVDEAVWPSSSLFVHALAAFAQCATSDLVKLLTDKALSSWGIFWGEAVDYRYMVANLPVLLGFWSMTGAPMTWWHRQRRLAVVEQVRVFDPQWFALAYQHGVMLAVVMGHHYSTAKVE